VAARQLLKWIPLSAAIVWLLVDGTRFVVDDLVVMAGIAGVTFATRGVGLAAGLSALAWSIALVAPLTVGIGAALDAVGLDMTSGAGNGVIVPLVEETGKLLPIGIAAALARRWRPNLLNPSDLLLLGAMSGAGFSMVESSYFDTVRTGARYGPAIGGLNLLPTAWGTVGYIGHAPATAFIAVCAGLGLYLKRAHNVTWWWAIPTAAFGWIAVEHSFANLYVNSGARVLGILGSGRVTPWLLSAAIAAAIGLDLRNARVTLGQSRELQKRRVLIAAFLARERRARRLPSFGRILTIVGQLRFLNTTAWFDTRARQTARAEITG
jgi:RsiW-degrading membrane proteinase PrsW (M82 family)